MAQYEAVKNTSRLFIIVNDEGVVIRAESPTHGCFDANFIGEPWETARAILEDDGFVVHTGN